MAPEKGTNTVYSGVYSIFFKIKPEIGDFWLEGRATRYTHTIRI